MTLLTNICIYLYIYNYIIYIGWSIKMAQLLVCHFQTAQNKISHKFTRHYLNMFSVTLWIFRADGQNFGMTVAWKLHVQKSNIVDTRILNVYSMHSAWHTAVIKKWQVCLWCQIVIIITVKYILNQCITH